MEARGYALEEHQVSRIQEIGWPPCVTHLLQEPRNDVPKVCGLQARGSRAVDVEDGLEMLVEGVEEAVAEAPEEEEDGDEADGEDGLAQRQLGGAGAARVVGLEGALLEELLGAHGNRARHSGAGLSGR